MSAIGYAASALGLLIVLAGLLAGLFSVFKEKTQDLLRKENADAYRRIETLEAMVKETAAREEECNRRLGELELTSKHMAGMLTGASAVGELATMVALNHDETLRILG